MKLFISYRRQDSQRAATALCRRLEEAFGQKSVFLDERAIALGADFSGTVGGAIYTSDVILVVIGPGWASMRDSLGKLRLEDEEDPVRMEVGLALASRRHVVPVLVEGADMPSKRVLPRALHHLTTLSGFRLAEGSGFDASVDELIRRLGGRPDRSAKPSDGRAPRCTTSLATFEGRWQTRTAE